MAVTACPFLPNLGEAGYSVMFGVNGHSETQARMAEETGEKKRKLVVTENDDRTAERKVLGFPDQVEKQRMVIHCFQERT
jgi:hypothetical protein